MLFSSVITLSMAQYSEENSTIHSPTIVNNCLAKFWSDWGNKSYSKFSSTILSETVFTIVSLVDRVYCVLLNANHRPPIDIYMYIYILTPPINLS